MRQRPFHQQRAKLNESLAPKCLHCEQPIRLRGMKVPLGKFRVPVWLKPHGWLCYACEPAVTQDSVDMRRNMYLVDAYPNGPRAAPVPNHKQLRQKCMPWLQPQVEAQE